MPGLAKSTAADFPDSGDSAGNSRNPASAGFLLRTDDRIE